jgi:Zn finger protein HypA/HybF involved in hydrogenase expression
MPHSPQPFAEIETGWACSRCLLPLTPPTAGKRIAAAKGLIDQEQYVRTFGQICPRCDSEKLSFADSQNDFGVFLETIDCDDCDLRFERVFGLSGYNVIE